MVNRVLVIFGTRPEAIKMIPVIRALQNEQNIDVRVCVTAQHREMLDQVLDLFEIVPDFDLDLMTRAQSLELITSAVLQDLSKVIQETKPDRILVHGDTTTTMTASIAAYYNRVPVGHVEAGLRSGNVWEPWPEEVNRRVTDVIADQYFAPTPEARANLIAENVDPTKIHVTGNTVIDSLLETVKIIETLPGVETKLREQLSFLNANKRIILVTAHRRENFGKPFEDICHAILDLASHDDVEIVFPVHMNPNVRTPVNRILGGRESIHLIEPLDYLPFVYLMMRSHLIITDSGGIQEEAPSLGKPVFVLRNVTERPEAVDVGSVKLIGTDRQFIVDEVRHALKDQRIYERMSTAHNPYGDGKASARIARIVAVREREIEMV